MEDNIEDDITYFNTGFGAEALEMANIKSKMRALEKRLLEKNSQKRKAKKKNSGKSAVKNQLQSQILDPSLRISSS